MGEQERMRGEIPVGERGARNAGRETRRERMREKLRRRVQCKAEEQNACEYTAPTTQDNYGSM